VDTDPKPLTDQKIAAGRRAGNPTIHLSMAVVGILVGFGFLALALWKASMAWTRGWEVAMGLAAGSVNVVGGTVQIFQWRRLRADHREVMKITCASCGYDRRGLAADAKCPECGHATLQPERR